MDHNHTITLQTLELRLSDRVEAIVLIEQDIEAEKKEGQSFLDAIAGIEIGAPADYSTAFEDNLYPNRCDS